MRQLNIVTVPSTFQLETVHANMIKADWSDADVIFINSTCFSKPLMEKIAAKAASLAPGSCVVTLTQHIVSQYFDLVESKKYEMSWGDATVGILSRSICRVRVKSSHFIVGSMSQLAES